MKNRIKTKTETIQLSIRVPIVLVDRALDASKNEFCSLPEFFRRAVSEKVARLKKSANGEKNG